MRAFATTAIVFSIVGVTRGAWAQDAEAGPPDNERYALRAELGVELDTNAHRSEVVGGVADPPVVASPLERVVLAGTLSDEVAPDQTLALAATAAAKLFDRPGLSEENVAVAQSSAAWRLGLGPRSRLFASGAYYDAFQSRSAIPAIDAERRDFRSLVPTLQLGWLPSEAVDLALGAGYRWLVFKSDRDFDFQGPTAAIDLHWAHQQSSGPDWEAGIGLGIEHRAFNGPALTNACASPGPPCPGFAARVDDLAAAHVEVTRTARFLAGLGYAFQYNRSNSFGDTVLRHFITLRAALPLPADVTLAARAELLFAFYKDPLTLASSSGCATSGCISIDNETRSSAQLDLSHPLTDRLLLFARATFYFNELSVGISNGSYSRQTLLLALSYTLEK